MVHCAPSRQLGPGTGGRGDVMAIGRVAVAHDACGDVAHDEAS